ncbi:MAG: phosphate ABC transporter, permease protein PstA, partial [Desulfovibrio sp.]|nr:phosphate ABC transporter, permease protein PstA [Desulfovibrio sp.]
MSQASSSQSGVQPDTSPHVTLPSTGKARGRAQNAMFWFLRGIAACNVLVLLGVCGFLFYHGLPAISWEFISQPPRNMMTEGGILPC